MSSSPVNTSRQALGKTLSADSAKFEERFAVQEHGADETFNSYYTRYPNGWSKIREAIREPAAEMLGTMMLTLIGCGANCQAALSANTGVASSPAGNFITGAIGWAAGVSLGAWVCAGISGGHVNPVVTICMAIFRGLSWKKVPGYIAGQVIGAWLGSLIVYGNYANAISIVEGNGAHTLKTGSLFGTYALDYMSGANCFLNEFIGAFTLLMILFAVTDKKNAPPPAGLVPLVLFIIILSVASTVGLQTGGAINPARDLGPRLMTAMVGYGSEVFTYRHGYWLWSPILGSICGGFTASLLYDVFIYTGPESPINTPSATAHLQLVRQKNATGQSVQAV